MSQRKNMFQNRTFCFVYRFAVVSNQLKYACIAQVPAKKNGNFFFATTAVTGKGVL